MYVATLIADRALSGATVSEWIHQFTTDWTAGSLEGWTWLEENSAADLVFRPDVALSRSDCAHLAEGLADLADRLAVATVAEPVGFDCIVQPLAAREKRLLVADMDSTMITVECLDELADYAGIKPEVAAITERAMRGELDFAGALDARVALLDGLPASAIDRCLAERVRLTPGAATLVRTMRARGACTVLVSGGFTRFAEPVAAMIGFDRVVANRLEIEGDRLTGRVEKPIVDAETKVRTLVAERDRLDLPAAATLAVGDGANDLGMIREAGLGVAYRAKPVVAAAAGARIDHGDLTALLHTQGIPPAEWVRG